MEDNGVNRATTNFGNPRYRGTSKQRGSDMPTFLSPSSGHDWRGPRVIVTAAPADDIAPVRVEARHNEPSSFAYGFN